MLGRLAPEQDEKLTSSLEAMMSYMIAAVATMESDNN
jgi:hypothetical protein